MAEIIQVSAGMVPLNDLMKQQQEQKEANLKIQYGDHLLQEENGFCPFPGCGRQLHIFNGTKTIPVYKVSLIDKEKIDCIEVQIYHRRLKLLNMSIEYDWSPTKTDLSELQEFFPQVKICRRYMRLRDTIRNLRQYCRGSFLRKR